MDYEKAYKEAFKRAERRFDPNPADGYAGYANGIIEDIFPQFIKREDERTRKEILDFIKRFWADHKESIPRISSWLAWLEKQKPRKFKLGDKVHWHDDSTNIITIIDVRDDAYLTDSAYGPILFCDEDNWEKIEQKPAESDAIKGGDFISDGKRVFLVLANVKERNLGETGSTFCEGLILGVDGVVYCDGDNFKKFKRATSDERAKFIHDLKVGVELKEQPAEWSEEDEKHLIWLCRIIHSHVINKELSLAEESELGKWIDKWINHKPQPVQKWDEFDEDCLKRAIWYVENPAPSVVKDTNLAFWLQSLPQRFNLQPKQEWNEEDERIINTIISLLGQYIDYKSVSGNSSGYAAPRYGREIDWLKSLRPQPKQEWSEEDAEMFVNVAASLRVYACGLESEEYKRHIKKEIDWFENRFKSLRPQPHWKPTKEQMEALKCAVNDSIMMYDPHGSPLKEEVTRTYSENLQSLHEQLKKRM